MVCTKVGKWNEWHLFWSFSFTEICKCLLNNKINHNYWHSFANNWLTNNRKYLKWTRSTCPWFGGSWQFIRFLILASLWFRISWNLSKFELIPTTFIFIFSKAELSRSHWTFSTSKNQFWQIGGWNDSLRKKSRQWCIWNVVTIFG